MRKDGKGREGQMLRRRVAEEEPGELSAS